MKISEKQIRKIIREALEEIPTAEGLEKVLMFKSKKYIYVSGGVLYINKSRSSAQRFKKLRQSLQSYLQKNWIHSDVIISNAGQLRSVSAALAGGGARQKGTKHGLGLACDVKYFIGLPSEATSKKVKKKNKETIVSLIASNKRLGIEYGKDVARLNREQMEEFYDLLDKAKKEDPSPTKSTEDILNDLMKSPREKYFKILDLESSDTGLEEDKLETFMNYISSSETIEDTKQPMLKYDLGRNKDLASNSELVKLIYQFVQLPENNDLIWGGSFGGSDPKNGICIGKGVDEFHHFEYTTAAGIEEVSQKKSPVFQLVNGYFGDLLGISLEEMCSNSDDSKAARGKLFAEILKYEDDLTATPIASADITTKEDPPGKKK